MGCSSAVAIVGRTTRQSEDLSRESVTSAVGSRHRRGEADARTGGLGTE